METTTKPVHIGRKITRIRELRGIKQEQIAMELGVSQQTISRMEASESVDADLLDKVAGILGVSVEAIKSFSEEAVFNYFNTFNDTSVNNGSVGNGYRDCTFNPIDKLIEVFEENKTLYERLLKSEQEKVELLKGKIQ
jgi:transcriptional regulator with XRE-family HTH domain